MSLGQHSLERENKKNFHNVPPPTSHLAPPQRLSKREEPPPNLVRFHHWENTACILTRETWVPSEDLTPRRKRPDLCGKIHVFEGGMFPRPNFRFPPTPPPECLLERKIRILDPAVLRAGKRKSTKGKGVGSGQERVFSSARCRRSHNPLTSHHRLSHHRRLTPLLAALR